MQLGISTSHTRMLLPGYRIVQLALDNSFPFSTLEDLAMDNRFSGILIMDVHELAFNPSRLNDQASAAAHYRSKWSFDRKMNRIVATWCQNTFAMANPYVGFLNFTRVFYRTGYIPNPPFLRTYPDRSRVADISKIDVVTYKRNLLNNIRAIFANTPAPSPDDWFNQALISIKLAEKIEARGGSVVFLRMPTSGEHWSLDESTYPRKLYWDRFAEKAGLRAIHFQDVPGVSELTSYDTSHFDRHNAVLFTDLLINELYSRKFLIGEN